MNLLVKEKSNQHGTKPDYRKYKSLLIEREIT